MLLWVLQISFFLFKKILKTNKKIDQKPDGDEGEIREYVKKNL